LLFKGALIKDDVPISKYQIKNNDVLNLIGTAEGK